MAASKRKGNDSMESQSMAEKTNVIRLRLRRTEPSDIPNFQNSLLSSSNLSTINHEIVAELESLNVSTSTISEYCRNPTTEIVLTVRQWIGKTFQSRITLEVNCNSIVGYKIDEPSVTIQVWGYDKQILMMDFNTQSVQIVKFDEFHHSDSANIEKNSKPTLVEALDESLRKLLFEKDERRSEEI